MSHTVDHAHKYAISDGMCALNGAPCVMLHHAEFCFLVRMPADCRRIEKNICALQRGEPRAFRIPLVPTDESSHAAIFSIKSLETEIARSEIIFLVIKRVVRDVHFA